MTVPEEASQITLILQPLRFATPPTRHTSQQLGIAFRVSGKLRISPKYASGWWNFGEVALLEEAPVIGDDRKWFGSLPKEMGFMKNLTLLDLRKNAFSGGLPVTSGEMSLLEGMLGGNDPFVHGCLDAVPWERLQTSVTLDISGSKCLGSIPKSLSQLKELRFLAFNNNLFSESLTSKLAALRSLSGRYLNGTNLTGAGNSLCALMDVDEG